ncbi:D-erythronate dehydrogenase [Zhongshania aliphaticivorans]|uniref:UDP-glucose 4-epimerase n=1 Tax=Zhongshania aliphaticivorans TaxID=1470434 RepID=A0A5S9Q1J5_9GAMM|nr:NAD(P)-dependent oxidoreductase [Zhongshania aliphaticivorans]CAA0110677.1 D-erythronate dehydrogenase [Zhongshania aliphaticivorans]CAA0118244.1 D-erythronate dehydrogenase [Zhongshania aliphaticivorans]CAA0122265.1 D-erythronate dehydrogenase [Zhongshania aliphaticivorans]
MKILITGAFGNLGQMCIEEALKQGYQLRCFDLDGTQNQKLKRRYQNRCEVILGDIRDTEHHRKLLTGVDAVIHNASLLPPLSENQAELAKAINVDATQALIQSMTACTPSPRLIFPSSVTVFGKSLPGEAVKTSSDKVSSSDNYTRHKIKIEETLKKSTLPWVILRVGVSVDARTLKADRNTLRQLLSVHPESPLEFVHPKDVALAMCNAAKSDEAIHKTLLIGGGQYCQISHYRFIKTAFAALGLTLPYNSEISGSYYTHWMDSSEAQKLLTFQHHSFEDYEREMKNKMCLVRMGTWPLRPLLNRILPYALSKI